MITWEETGYSLLATLLTFGAGWVNLCVHPFSALWWLTAIIIFFAGIYAIKFWLILGAYSFVVALVLGLIGYCIAFPW